MPGMKKIVVIFVFLVAFVAWEVSREFFLSYPIVNYPPNGSLVMVWGDSLSSGVGASSPTNGYVGILKERLSLKLVNKAVSGETTRDVLLHSERDLNEVHPDIVMILLGGNDLLQQMPLAETLSNLRKLIVAAQKQKAVVYLIGFQKHIDDNYANGFKALARETGAVYTGDILGGIIGNQTLMADEIHPNDKGYLKMADKIAPNLESLVLSGSNVE
jgi:acyl-CoA thioesterase-1